MRSVIELPFNQFIGLQPSPDANALLQVPAGAHYLNHLGTVHASAQLALAEATSGEFLLKQLGSIEGIVPVVRRLEARFRKPANGVVAANASVEDEALSRLIEELKAKGRALITVKIELHDESGAHTLSASVEWFVTRVAG
jgi:acyl-coenzyme A thioesterase PaaI-like protein